MRNKFAGPCFRCGQTVAAGEGHFEKLRPERRRLLNAPTLTKWLTQHAACAIRYRDTDKSIWKGLK